MADDIVTRLRSHMVPDLPNDVCVRCKAADEIERLRTALALACGVLSTCEDHSMFHPEQLMYQFINLAAKEADRG